MSEPFIAHRDSASGLLLRGSERFCARVKWVCVAAALLIGVTNLSVWLFPAAQIAAAWPGVMVIRANNAIGISAAALSLILWSIPRGKRPAQGFALVAAAIGGLTSMEYLLGLDLGIDTLVVAGTFPGDRGNAFVAAPGRMSLNAALPLFFIGLALIGLDWSFRTRRGTRIWPAPGLALFAALPAVSGLAGYLLNAGQFTGILRSTNILLHAAIALLGLSLAVLAARPGRPPVSRVLSPGTDGVLLRWLLPGSSILFVGLAWLIAFGRKAEMVAPGEGAALMLYGGLVLFLALIVAVSGVVARQERTAAQAVRQSEQRFRDLADNISQLAWMTDETGWIVWYNRRWFEYTGATLEEMEGWGWKSVHHPGHLDRVMEKFKGAIARGDDWEDLFPLRAFDGEYRWFLSRAMPIRDEAGKVQRWFGTNTDVTEQRELSEELARAKLAAEEASRAKDDFLATLSHELRTPLTPVLLTAGALRRDERLPADLRADVAMIERNVALEGRLIDDLLDLTRIARGRLPLRKEPCDGHSLLGHALEIVREDLEARGIGLTTNLSARRAGLHGDPARLQQVFWNLLKNAVKFTPVGGEITVRTRDGAEDGSFIVEIGDTGMGFDPAKAESLFLPFEQGRANDHRFGGLGLGLSIARTVVDLHGGAIRAESEGPGSGATFTVCLPNAVEPPPGAALEKPPAGSANARPLPLRILLTEDHPHTLEVLARLLSRAGHRVTPANCASAATSLAHEETFDVLISDLGLPDGTGFDVVRAVKARHPAIYAIALSGYGMEKDLQNSRDAGFDVHLIKPVDFEHLLQALPAVPAPG